VKVEKGGNWCGVKKKAVAEDGFLLSDVNLAGDGLGLFPFADIDL